MVCAFCILAVVCGCWGIFAGTSTGLSTDVRRGLRNSALMLTTGSGAWYGLVVVVLFAESWSAVPIGGLVGLGSCALGLFAASLFGRRK